MIDRRRPQSEPAWQHHARALRALDALAARLVVDPCAPIQLDPLDDEPAPALVCSGARPLGARATTAPDPTALDVLTADLDALPARHPAWEAGLDHVLLELRAALDAFVRSCADPATLTPAQRDRLRFPIVGSHERWQPVGVRALPGVPAAQRDRIRDLQPFARPEHERAHHPLALMASLEAGTGEPHPRLWPAPGSRATPMADHVLLASPAGPVPAVATLHDLAVAVALVLAHLGDESGRIVRAVPRPRG